MAIGEREFGKYQPMTQDEKSGAQQEMKRVLPKCSSWPYGPHLGSVALELSKDDIKNGLSRTLNTLEQSWGAANE
jgi:hypothetical protein